MFKTLRNFFFTHEDNNHHPHIWRLPGTFAFIGAVILVETYFFTGSYLLISGNSFLASVFPNALVAFTNDVREGKNIAPLKENDTLAKAAQIKANDMAARGYFSHYTPEGLPPWTFISQAGYQYSHAGENLAVNFVDSKDVVDAWVASPTHYANLIKDEYKEIGIATAEGNYQGKKTIFIVEFFGTPKSPSSESILAVNTQKATTTVAKVIKKITPEPQILHTDAPSVEIGTTTAASTTVATTASTTPVVAGLESDTDPQDLHASPAFFLTYPRHVVSIILSLFALLITILVAVAIKTHNKEHHWHILSIALWFLVIVGLALLLNFVFAAGVI
ncbi:MAG: hypothetical protein JWP09_538 [Candidatus Taylorbacteria bacterium]|nr:hypothetical protein [Candidatus Taylorbacteria bacterium]